MHNLSLPITFFFLLTWFPTPGIGQWSQLPVPGSPAVHQIETVDSLWLITTEKGVFLSSNNGLSWMQTYTFDYFYEGAITVFQNEVYLYDPTKGLFRSDSGGSEWQFIPGSFLSFGIEPIGLTATEQYVFVNTKSRVYRFHKQGLLSPLLIFDQNSMGVSPALLETKNETLWLLTKDSLLRSNDFGTEWILVHEGLAARDFHVEGNTMMLCNWLGIYRSVNEGQSWEIVSNTTNCGYISWSQNHWFAQSGSYNIISIDQGLHWDIFAETIQNTPFLEVGRKDNILLAATSHGVLHSVDSGQHWLYRNGGISSAPEGKIYAIADQISINDNLTEDGGNVWHKPLFPASSTESRYIFHNDAYYKIVGNKIYKSNTLHQFEALASLPVFSNQNDLLSVGGQLIIMAPFMSNSVLNIYLFNPDNLNIEFMGSIAQVKQYQSDGEYIFILKHNSLLRSAVGNIVWEPVGTGLENVVQETDIKLYILEGKLFVVGKDSGIYYSNDHGQTFVKVCNNPISTTGEVEEIKQLEISGTHIVSCTYKKIYYCQNFDSNWIDITQNIPLGDAYDLSVVIQRNYIYALGAYGQLWKRPLTPIYPYRIAGVIFDDLNGNGFHNSFEPPLEGIIVQSASNKFATSASNGSYELYLPNVTDSVFIKKTPFWLLTEPTYRTVYGSQENVNFGVQKPGELVDFNINLINQTAFIPGETCNVSLQFKNSGTIAVDGIIRFVAQAGLSIISADVTPNEISNDTLVWWLSDFPMLKDSIINIQLKVPENAQNNGQSLAYAYIESFFPDFYPTDNEYWLNESITHNAFQVYDKECNTTTITPQEIATGEYLSYTIRFNYHGDLTIDYLSIVDTLDEQKFDIGSCILLAASHPCIPSIKESGVAEFAFPGINLKPAQPNVPPQQVYVKFSIKPLQGLVVGETLRNSALISVNHYQTVYTDTTSTKIVAFSDLNSPAGQSTVCFKEWPNPVIDLLHIEAPTSGILNLFNAQGKLCIEKEIFAGQTALDLSTFINGIYFLQLTNKDGSIHSMCVIKN